MEIFKIKSRTLFSLGIAVILFTFLQPELSAGRIEDTDDGRTIIYTSDKSRESEIRSRYALRK